MNALTTGTLQGTASEAMSGIDAPRAGLMWPGESVAAELVVRDGRDAQIVYDGITRPARIAFGCLVQPEPGDRVLTSLADGTIWVVSVLERHSDAPSRLWTEGNLGIVSAGGDISLMAGKAVDIAAGTKILAAALELDLHAGVAHFVLDELVHVGRKISWYVNKLRSLGEVVETFAEHVLTRATRSSRFIAESDQMRAGDIDHRAEGTLQLQADLAFVSADTLVRVDAEQIHMG